MSNMPARASSVCQMACVRLVSRHADSGIEEELAERFGIYITPDVYERFGCVDEGPERGESVRSYARDDARSNFEQER